MIVDADISLIRIKWSGTGGKKVGRPKGRPGTFWSGLSKPRRAAILFEVMANAPDVIRKIREQVTEIDPRDVHDLLQNGSGNS